MSKRGFLNFSESTQSISVDSKTEGIQFSQSFLYHLLLPYIECYWMTLTYFLIPENRKVQHDEATLYGKI